MKKFAINENLKIPKITTIKTYIRINHKRANFDVIYNENKPKINRN